jgi:hypothetical protein
MSAVAALAVVSPFAVTALTDMTANPKPTPEEHEFVQAALVTDLPGEVMSALQSTLSQFGVVVPNISSLGSSSTPASSALAPGGLSASPSTLTAPGLTATTPGLSAPALPGLTAPTTPAITAPNSVLSDTSLANPGLTPGAAPTTPGLTAPTTPALTTPATAGLPGLTTPTAATPGLPGLTTPSAATPGLTTPSLGPNAALTSPLTAQSLTGAPSEVPISAPIDPLTGGYPVMDPSLLAMPTAAAPASGGLLQDLSSAANQLGATQAIDLLKGVLVPSIMQAIKSVPAVPAAVPTP